MAAGETAVRWLGGYLERVATWQVDRATPPRGDVWSLPLRSRASSEARAAGQLPTDRGRYVDSQTARAAAALGVLQRRQRPGERQLMAWDFPAWPDAARAAFAVALEGGASWSSALAAAADRGAASGSSGALAVPVALERARAVEAWGRVQMAQASPAGEVQVQSPNETRVYRWGLDMWKLPGGNPAGLEPRYLLARRTFGLSEAEARAFASGAGVSSAAAQAARPGGRVVAPALTRAPEASSRARPPRTRSAAAAPRRAAEAGSPVVAVGAGAAVGALAGPALLGTGLGVSAAGGALAGYLLAGGASAATLGAPDTPPHEGDYWISTDDARDYARWLAGKVEALHTEAAAWMYDWSTLERANEWFRATDWQDWRSKWRAYHADLEDSWASRVGAWRDIKAWHGEYRAKRDHAAALGLPLSSASAAPLPDEVTDQLHRGAGEWWAEVTGGVARAGLGVLLLGAGVLALVWASQDV